MNKFLSLSEVLEKAIRIIMVPLSSMDQKELDETIRLYELYCIQASEIISRINSSRIYL